MDSMAILMVAATPAAQIFASHHERM